MLKRIASALVVLAIFSVAAFGQTCGSATTVYSQPLPWTAQGSAGWAGWAARPQVVVSAGGNQIRVTVVGEATHAVQYDHISVGVQSSAFATTATPIELKFSGASGYTMPIGSTSEQATDWTDFSFGAGTLIVDADYNAASAYTQFNSAGGATGYKSSAAYNTASGSGFTSTPNHFVVSKIEARTCTAPPSPAAGVGVRVSLPLLHEPGSNLFGGTPFTPPANDAIVAGSDYWFQRERVIRYQQQGFVLSGPGFVFMGDSLCDRMDVTQAHPFAQNDCIAGNTPSGMLNQVADLTAAANGRALVIVGGAINSISRGTATATIESQLDTLMAARSGNLIWVPILPTGDAGWNATATTINAHVAATLSGCSTCVTVDVSATLAPGGTPNPAMFTSDEGTPLVHLSGAGAAVVLNAIRDAIGSHGF